MLREKLGFVGAGALAAGLIRGILQAGLVPAGNIMVTNRGNGERLRRLAAETGVVPCSKAELAGAADVVFLAMKPQDLPGAVAELAGLLGPGQRVISLAAGVSLAFLEARLPGRTLLRAMPNTSCRVGASATAVALGKGAGTAEAELARCLFAAVGRVVLVPEEQMDAVTGLSGSGPAYVYLLTEALTAAGVGQGLDAAVARALAVQTVWGAGKMLVETGEAPEILRRQVTSPGGTTMAGVGALEEGGFQRLVDEAVRRAAVRSRELGVGV